MNRQRLRKPRKPNSRNEQFFSLLTTELKSHPEKIDIIKANLDEYRDQKFLKKGFLLAIERLDWVFAVDNDVERICKQIHADDYIGNRLRRFPLLFKGIISD